MIIPYLREDLEILRGNSREDGSPAWLLYDALRNKYFTLGLTAFKLIKNWSGGEDIKVFEKKINRDGIEADSCLLYTSPSPRDRTRSRMPSSA